MKRSMIALCLGLLFLAGTTHSQDSRGLTLSVKQLDKKFTAGKQYVLLIAIDRYEKWPALRNPVKDARDIKAILAADYYVDEFIELYDEAATKANIIKTLEGLQKKLQTNDSLLVYYAGHGHLDQFTNTGFWIPVNAGTDKYEQTNWLPNMQLRGMLTNLRPIHILVISDSCFSGDLLNASRALPDEINNAYFAKAYSRISRQILSSGASETVPDESEFARMLKLALRKNESAYLDPLMLYGEIRLGVKGTLPMYGNLRDTGHQDGASFILFRKVPEKRDESVVKTEPKKVEKAKATAVTAKAESSFIDEFDGQAIGAGWSWVRENPAKWSLKERPGSLLISTETGDLVENNNNARNLLLRDPGMNDFTIETKVEFRPLERNHQAGIVMYLDDGNYVSLIYGIIPAEDSTIAKIALFKESENSCTRKTAEVTTDRVYLRLVKASDTYTGYYSWDGISYTAVGKFPINLGGVPQVGLYACAGYDSYAMANPKNSAFFDYFSIYPNGQPIVRKETAPKEKETKKETAAVVVKDKPAPEPAVLKGEFRESFDGSTLGTGWSWLRENPAKWSLRERTGSLLISTELGDLYGTDKNGKNILLRDPGAADFTLETKVELEVTMHWQQTGLIVYLDDDNYVAALYGSHPNDDVDVNLILTKKVGFTSETKADVKRVLLSYDGKAVYLRLVKKGDAYTAFFSADGITFNPIGELTNDLGRTPKVGLLAYSGNENWWKFNPKGSAYVDYFRIIPAGK